MNTVNILVNYCTDNKIRTVAGFADPEWRKPVGEIIYYVLSSGFTYLSS